MWLFLGTEVLLFGGLFTAYALFRAKFPALFHESSTELNLTLGAVKHVHSSVQQSYDGACGGASKTGGKRKDPHISRGNNSVRTCFRG